MLKQILNFNMAVIVSIDIVGGLRFEVHHRNQPIGVDWCNEGEVSGGERWVARGRLCLP